MTRRSERVSGVKKSSARKLWRAFHRPFGVEPLESRTLLAGNPIANGAYTLTNGASNLYMDATNITGSNGAQMDQNINDSVDPAFGRDEQWQFTYNGAGYYTIMNFFSGLYLEDPGGSATSGTALEQGTADGGTDQLWSLTASAGGSYILTNEAGGIVADDPGSSTTAKTLLDVATASGGSNQNWNFAFTPLASTNPYTLQSGKSNLYLDDPNSSQSAGTQITQQSSNSGYDQDWLFVFNGNGYYTIQDMASGQYLEDPGSSNTPGVALEQGAADGGADQLWSLIAPANGATFNIVNKASGLLVDDTGNSTSSGTGMDLYTANGGSNQKWNFNVSPKIDSGIYTLSNHANSQFLDDPNSSTISGTQMVQNPANSGRDQDFQFKYTGYGFYTIQNDISGLYLEDPGSSTVSGTALEQATADGGNDQFWYPTGSASGVVWRNAASGLVIDDPGSSAVAGTGMDLATYTNGSNQAWTMAQVPIVYPATTGHLIYLPDANGNTIPNFSLVGYETGDVPLPDTTGGVQVPIVETVNPSPTNADMTATIQAAINAAEALPMQSNGFRGAVLLTAGNYAISGQPTINTSGVVLEGQGNNSTNGTRLEATGTNTRQLININGSGGPGTTGSSDSITDSYVPVGATSFDVNSASNLSVGETVEVYRPSTQTWIDAIGMNELNNPWGVGTGSQTWYRTITAINGNNVTINAPITMAISSTYGGGTVTKYTWTGAINNDGVENLYAYSDSTGPDDTNHAAGVLTVNNAENMWVNNITSNGFASNHVELGGSVLYSTLTNMTIENTSVNADPPSGVLTSGQFLLIENSTFINAYHAIAVLGGDGPDVYYNLTASGTGAQIGPHEGWTTGELFDNNNVSGTQLGIIARGNGGTAQGDSGANYVLWNDTSSEIDNWNYPTAQNWVIGGSAGTVNSFDRTQANVPGDFIDFGTTVQPQSLYIAQLLDRLTPTVSTAAAAAPSPVTAKTTTLTTLGADVAGESVLIYTWAVTSAPAGAPAVQFSASNGTNAGKSTTATFGKAGPYTLLVTIQYPGGFSATSSVNVTVNQTLTTITVSPSDPQIGINTTQQFSASAVDQFGNAMSPTFTWTATAGAITQAGYFTAPSSAGPVTVKATSGAIVGSTTVTVINYGPNFVNGPSANPSPVTGTSTALSVLGSDAAGESAITYTWSVLGNPPAPVMFSANATNAAKNSTATFTSAGTYSIQISMTDTSNLTTTATIQVVVQQTPTAIMVTPNSSSLVSSQTEQFTATELDQFDNVMAASFNWAASAGSIGNDGVFNAPAAGGSYTVTASTNGISGNATVMVGNSPPVITTPAAASPGTISSGGSTTLSVSATDDGGASNLTYTWTDLTEPVNAVTPVFGGVNGSNAGQSTPVTLVTTGQYLFHVTITDLGGLVASGNTSVSVTSGQGGSTNASVATASSTAAGSNPSYAIDGNTSTAWTSASGGNQWLEIDLGTVQTFSKVKITWGAQYASSYAIQVSTNGTTWKTEYYTTHGTGGTGGYAGITAQARYVRFLFYATPYTDYSINEIKFFS